MKRKNKNGFTLIELLAVIVILAIIALIATPIILGIVEDAKKDAFLRSVELVVSSTDLDAMNKLTGSGYTYELMDGKISDRKEVLYYTVSDNCETIISEMGVPMEDVSAICNNEPYFSGLSLTEFVTQNPSNSTALLLINAGAVQEVYNYHDLNLAKNTEGMNGTISYNASGKEAYAIHNGIYCVKKKPNMDKAIINDYIEGECNVYLTFQEFLDFNPSEGTHFISGNGQIINLGKYGIRYQGANPDNYIYFNCSDYSNQTSETCELWRIIGVVDGKVKIRRMKSIGEYAWNTNDNNNWSTATLNNYLNNEEEGGYYYSLTEATKTLGLISPSTWHLRASQTRTTSGKEMYDLERTTGTVLYETPQIDNIKIGIMYVSDYLLSVKTYSWSSGRQAFITPSTYGICPYSYGRNGITYINIPTNIWATYPVLYLSSNIEFLNEGTITNPYQIKIIEE